MPGTTPPTSQLEWLSSTTAMIVLFWSRATRDLLRSFGWGIAALHRENAATKLPCLAARPIASIGPAGNGTAIGGPPKSILAISDLTLGGSTDRADVPMGNPEQSLLQQRDRWFESG